MKTFTAVSALLLSAASATPVGQRQTTVTEYDITNFIANTTTGAYVSYDIEIPGVLSTSCSYSDPSAVGGNLPIIGFVACDDASVEWEFHEEPSQFGGSPYLMVITYADGTGKKVGGSQEWRAEEFPVDQDAQVYIGDSDFVISNVA